MSMKKRTKRGKYRSKWSYLTEDEMRNAKAMLYTILFLEFPKYRKKHRESNRKRVKMPGVREHRTALSRINARKNYDPIRQAERYQRDKLFLKDYYLIQQLKAQFALPKEAITKELLKIKYKQLKSHRLWQNLTSNR